MHPVFHVSLLREWRESDWDQDEQAPVPELVAADERSEIEKLLRWRYVRQGNRRVREFLVLWVGWPLDDATWVPESAIGPPEHVDSLLQRDQPVEDVGGSSRGD